MPARTNPPNARETPLPSDRLPSLALIYAWSPAAVLDNPSIAQPTATVTQEQEYILTVIDSSRSCRNVNTDTVRVGLLPPAPPLADAGPDKPVCPGDTAMIGTPAIPGYLYEWSPAANLANPYAAQTPAMPSQTQIWHLSVTDPALRCFNTSVDSVELRIVPCTGIFIPSAFSPNGDGNNESFAIGNLPPDSRLVVFHRWGKVAFESDNYDNNWRAGGLPPGVYIYVLSVPENKKYWGTVTVVR